jgi:hypothetical protein
MMMRTTTNTAWMINEINTELAFRVWFPSRIKLCSNIPEIPFPHTATGTEKARPAAVLFL